MTYNLRYHSSRREIWTWYWRAWKKTLWCTHLVAAAVLGFVLSGAKLSAVDVSQWFTYAAFVFLAVVTVSVAASQLLFKAEARTLEITPNGWSTTIGKKSGAKSWAQVDIVEEHGGSIVIQGRNGSAFIIPNRAFTSQEQKESFLLDAKRWHQEHRR
jgi:hypothetical protein